MTVLQPRRARDGGAPASGVAWAVQGLPSSAEPLRQTGESVDAYSNGAHSPPSPWEGARTQDGPEGPPCQLAACQPSS